MGTKGADADTGFWIENAHQTCLTAVFVEEISKTEFLRASSRSLGGSSIRNIESHPMHAVPFLFTEGLHSRLNGLASRTPGGIDLNKYRLALKRRRKGRGRMGWIDDDGRKRNH